MPLVGFLVSILRAIDLSNNDCRLVKLKVVPGRVGIRRFINVTVLDANLEVVGFVGLAYIQ